MSYLTQRAATSVQDKGKRSGVAERRDGEPDQMEFSDFQVGLRERAQALLNAGRYKYVWMVMDDMRGDWDLLADFDSSRG